MTGERPPIALELNDLYKAFGAHDVLTGLNLNVYRGEVLSLLGPSGCGKSVLLKIIIGLVEPDAGEVIFDGKRVDPTDVRALAALRQRVGMVFQGAALFDSLTVGENVAYGLHELHAPAMPRAEIRKRVAWALDAVGLPGSEHQFPGELSGGMRKRAGVARTIALRPEVILYDEPTTGLDPINSVRIAQVILDLQRDVGVTSLIVTHDVSLALAVSDRLAFLDGGRIAAVGTPAEMRTSNVPIVRAFLRAHVERAPSEVAPSPTTPAP